MNFLSKLFSIVFVLGYTFGNSQTSNPIYLNSNNISLYNPAFAGIDNGLNIGYRSSIKQHSYFPRPFYNNGLDFNGKSQKFNSGFGFNISHDYQNYSTRELSNFPHPQFKHSLNSYNFVNAKLNYNYQLKMGSNSLISLGTSAGISFFHSKSIFDNSEKRSNTNSTPIFSFGLRYEYKKFFVGASLGNITLPKNNRFIYRNYISAMVGFDWKILDNFRVEPSLLLKSGIMDEIILFQNNFVFHEKFNLGGGFRFDYLNDGYFLFVGIKVKQKVNINLAYQKYNYNFSNESNDYWLNKSGLELGVIYRFK